MSEQKISSKPYKQRLPLYIGIAVTPVFVVFAALSGGVGHGSYLPAILLFPYASAAGAVVDSVNLHWLWMWVVLPLALIQYPLYGRLIGLVWSGSRGRFYLYALCFAHALVLIGIYTVGGGW